MAAHAEARRLDPHVPTSLGYTLLVAGEYERLVREPAESTIDLGPKVLALHWMGRTEEARHVIRGVDLKGLPSGFRRVVESIQAYVEGRREEALAGFDGAIAVHDDPEAFFLWSTALARLDEPAQTLDLLGRVTDGGFVALPSLERDPAWDGLRSTARFPELLARARERRALAEAAYRAAGGDRLLGV